MSNLTVAISATSAMTDEEMEEFAEAFNKINRWGYPLKAKVYLSLSDEQSSTSSS